MIRNGVALVRLANSPSGCAGRDGKRLDEFYVIVFKKKILTTRFQNYAAAFNHLKRLRLEDVA